MRGRRGISSLGTAGNHPLASVDREERPRNRDAVTGFFDDDLRLLPGTRAADVRAHFQWAIIVRTSPPSVP
jgi:hypothetical protein